MEGGTRAALAAGLRATVSVPYRYALGWLRAWAVVSVKAGGRGGEGGGGGWDAGHGERALTLGMGVITRLVDGAQRAAVAVMFLTLGTVGQH